MENKSYKFNIAVPSEPSAGIRGFTDTILITVESGDPGGVPGEFEKHIIEALSDWYDGGHITLIEEKTK